MLYSCTRYTQNVRCFEFLFIRPNACSLYSLKLPDDYYITMINYSKIILKKNHGDSSIGKKSVSPRPSLLYTTSATHPKPSFQIEGYTHALIPGYKAIDCAKPPLWLQSDIQEEQRKKPHSSSRNSKKHSALDPTRLPGIGMRTIRV